MSTFAVNVVRIDAVDKHPNADRLTLNRIGGYVAISNLKDDGTPRYKAGDLVAYIPEGAVVPEWVLKKYGYWNEKTNMGFLAGPAGDRVKAVKLRGVLSQGIILPLMRSQMGISMHGVDVTDQFEPLTIDYILDEKGEDHPLAEGEDVAGILGITKYTPPIPDELLGAVTSIHGAHVKFDIEDIKRYPDAFSDGEEVVMTEKIHGIQTIIGYIPGLNNPDLPGDWFVTSKGLAEQGLAFKTGPENDDSVYVQVARKLDLATKMREIMADSLDAGAAFAQPIYVVGEIAGPGVQDLNYGFKEKFFRAFDVFVGSPNSGEWLGYDQKLIMIAALGLTPVPTLYHGPFSKAVLDEHTTGKTSLRASLAKDAGPAHIREGVVVTPVTERRDDRFGRVILKSINPDYLVRPGDTTEYQ